MALPNTYQQVEYIESSNTQYIKIGNSWNSSYKTEAVLQITGTVDVMFGIRDDIANVHRYGLRGQNGYFKGVTGSQSGISQTTFPLDTNKHNISLYNGTLTIDGNSYSVYNTSNVSFSNGMTIFGYTLGSTSGAASYFRVFSFKVYNGTTLLYDLIPCYRKSDNKPGLYDLVNDVFYTNQGTGEFLYPAQNGIIKKFLLGTSLIRPKQTLTEKFTLTTPNTDTLIAKSGYKIKSLEYQSQFSYSGSGRYRVSNGITYASGTNPYFNVYNPFGPQWGYDYGRNDQYGQLRGGDASSNTYRVLSFNSSRTSSSSSAYNIIITEDTIEYKIGTTYGTRNTTGTISRSSSSESFFQQVETIFASANATHKMNSQNFPITITKNDIIVTYEGI